MKLNNRHWIKSWVKIVLPFYLFTFLPLTSSAQGLPLIRNFTATEYGGHNRNYDIEIGEDGTIFVANFEGLLYYDRAQWRIIHAPDINRVTVVYRDSKNTIWVGGYNFIAHLQKNANGELFLQRMSKEGLFEGEVLDIFEESGSLQFVVSDNRGNAVPHPWHPNIRYFGEFAGRVCINMADTYTDLLWGVRRVASYLRYETYHALLESPYPEDLKVATWVMRQGEPNGWLLFEQ